MSGINLSARVWNSIKAELNRNGYQIVKKKELKEGGKTL